MTTVFAGMEGTNSLEATQGNLALLDRNVNITLAGGNVTLTAGAAGTGARGAHIVMAVSAVDVVALPALPYRSLVPFYCGFSIIVRAIPPSTLNLVEWKVGGNIQRELSMNSSGAILFANGSNGQINSQAWTPTIGTKYWLTFELLPGGRRPYDRCWYDDGATVTRLIDDVYAAVLDKTGWPIRDPNATPWDAGTFIQVNTGDTGKTSAVCQIDVDDFWAFCPSDVASIVPGVGSSAGYVNYWGNRRLGTLNVASMLPTSDVTTGWDQAAPQFSRVNDLTPSADIAAAGAATQIDSATASKVSQFALGAMPAGKLPIAVKVNLAAGVTAGMVQYGIVSGADSSLKAAVGAIIATPFAAKGENPDYFEGTPNATPARWTETLVNALNVKVATDPSNAARQYVGGIALEVLHEVRDPQVSRVEPWVGY